MVDVDRNRDNLFADNAGDLHSRSDGAGLLLKRFDIGWIGQELEATSSRVHFTGLSFPASEFSSSPSLNGKRTIAWPGFSAPPLPWTHTRAVLPAPHRRSNRLGIATSTKQLALSITDSAARVQCRKIQAVKCTPQPGAASSWPIQPNQVASEEAQHHRYGNVGRWRCQQKDCPDYDPRPPFVVSRHGFCSSQGVSGEHTPEFVTNR
jgi:hypothetical protein